MGTGRLHHGFPFYMEVSSLKFTKISFLLAAILAIGMTLAFGQGKAKAMPHKGMKPMAGAHMKGSMKMTGQARATMARHHGKMSGMKMTGQTRAAMARHHGRMMPKTTMRRRHHRRHHRTMMMVRHRTGMKVKAGK